MYIKSQGGIEPAILLYIVLHYLRYKQEFVKEVEDMSHPIFNATALYTACRYVSKQFIVVVFLSTKYVIQIITLMTLALYFLRYKKIKIDKTKLLSVLGTCKRSTFDSLFKKMEKIPDMLEASE